MPTSHDEFDPPSTNATSPATDSDAADISASDESVSDLRVRRTKRQMSRRASILGLAGASAAAIGGGVHIMAAAIIRPREIETGATLVGIGPTPMPIGAGIAQPLRTHAAGSSETAVAAPPADAAVAQTPVGASPEPVQIADAPTPPPRPSNVTQPIDPAQFLLGAGKYSPADLAYIDRQAPKTAQGLPAVRGLWLVSPHTGENVLTLFWSVGRYDNTAYSEICQLMRDWRENQTVAMDPRLLHLLWAIQRKIGFSEPISITSGFRTIKTNTMLRAEGAAVNSQHLHSRACDIQIAGKAPANIAQEARAVGAGGVGIYSRFCHLDTGARRQWYG